MYWNKMCQGPNPLLQRFAVSIEQRIGDSTLSYFSRFLELTEVFGRIGVPIPNKDPKTGIQPLLGMQPLQYVEAHQAHQQQLDALLAIWPKIRNQINFEENPVPAADDTAAIRHWLTDPATADLRAQIIGLDLSNLGLRTLPPEIGNFPRLLVLNLTYNQLVTLPPEIGNLPRLQELNLANNQLAILPPEIGNLPNLQQIYLHNNALIYLLDKDLSSLGCSNSHSVLAGLVDKHSACSTYPCQLPLAALCQAIHLGKSNESLRQQFEMLSPPMQQLIRTTRATLLSRSIPSLEAENDLFSDRTLLTQALMSVLREKFNSLPVEERILAYRRVSTLAGQPSNTAWGRTHATDNLIRFIDAIAFFMHENV
jgi:hypothetical protein